MTHDPKSLPKISDLLGHDPDCKICVDGWVCENHPDKSWPSECECGAGMPCVCSPLYRGPTKHDPTTPEGMDNLEAVCRLHIRDHEIVGTPCGPDVENGVYVWVGKLPSEGGALAPYAPPLAAAWMQRQAALEGALATVREALREWDALIQHQYSGSRAAMSDMTHCAQHTAAILALIPLPTDADRLAAALRLPEIKRLVAVCSVMQDAENYDKNGGVEVIWDEFCAALASLPDAEGRG